MYRDYYGDPLPPHRSKQHGHSGLNFGICLSGEGRALVVLNLGPSAGTFPKGASTLESSTYPQPIL